MLKSPMLAAKLNDFDMLNNIKYPIYGSYKIDGVRGLHIGRLASRKFIDIPNHFTRNRFSIPDLYGLDGELVCGNPWDKNLMQATMSATMTYEGEPDVKWYIFDKWDVKGRYVERAKAAREVCIYENVIWVSQRVLRSWAEVLEMEAEALEIGYEGLILRAPDGPYKCGRSTVKQGWLSKIKRFVDGEAIVIGTSEEMANDNEATTDALGYTKRSSHAENKRAKGTLGKLHVTDKITGVAFDIGTGFTKEQRQNLWEGRKYLIGKIAKYKHFPVGVVDRPRHPVFLGFRDPRDM